SECLLVVDPNKFPLDDKKTIALLQRGETKGVFQLESGGIRDLLQKMKPDHFGDIIATNALYRPGPLEGGMVDDYVAVKNGRKAAEYIHPICEKILAETHGVMVYQEQVMRILNELGGIELASAYTCIKAISKKKEETINKSREQFFVGSTQKGLSKTQAEDFWNLIIKFAGYGFNKSHSTAYALIAYMTAYLKAHYPLEFMASLLSGDIHGRNFVKKDSLVEHLEDAKRMGIEVLPPSVNSSLSDFAVVDGKIAFGISAIKGCGGAAAEAIVSARKKGGPFKDLFDYCERVDQLGANKTSLETLIKSGSMDCFGARRSQLYASIERAIQSGSTVAADRKAGQKNLFGGFEDDAPSPASGLPDMAEWADKEKAQGEKEVLGFYLSTHPLAEHRGVLETYRSHTTADIPGLQERAEVILGGMIGSIKLASVKEPKPGKPSRYANFDFEDTEGIIRCIAWPEQYAESAELITADNILMLRGVIDRRGGDEANLVVNEVIPLDQLDARYTSGIVIRISETEHPADVLPRVREVLRAYPGSGDLQFCFYLENGSRVFLKAHAAKISITRELRERLDDLLGPGNLQLITTPPKPAHGSRPHRPPFQRAGAR
ncbi:MAG: DNA polymerase III subunit alpha, partial [Pirellulaceae bacterium]|nr:DNA polymerase III subunit alpha [Pirellulaceae bacterium]